MDDKTRLDADRRMGMKHSEIVDVDEVAGGVVITTNDGIKTFVSDADGSVRRWDGDPPLVESVEPTKVKVKAR